MQGGRPVRCTAEFRECHYAACADQLEFGRGQCGSDGCQHALAEGAGKTLLRPGVPVKPAEEAAQ